jgi:hypothetical protein
MATIYYYAYDHQKPRGGQKVAYRHVDILRADGREAFIRHTTPGFRLSWFENSTPVVDDQTFRSRFDPDTDVIVLPEDLGVRISTFRGRKVIFNQGAFNGFYTFGFRKPPEYPYLRPDVLGAMAVSGQNCDYLRFAFPALRVRRVVNGIDAARFRFGGLRNKRLQVAYVPTKSGFDVTQVVHLLESRARQGLNRLAGLEWIALSNLSEEEVAQTLRDSLFLIFPSIHEGMPMLPLEAMLSGAIVAGYLGGPLVECLSEDTAVTAAPGDCAGLAMGIERVAGWFMDGDVRLQAMAERARQQAAWHSRDRERQTVLAVWNELAPTPAGVRLEDTSALQARPVVKTNA